MLWTRSSAARGAPAAGAGAGRQHASSTPAAAKAAAPRLLTRTAAAVREQKDPKRFSSMDEAREYLQRGAAGPSLAGALNWLGSTLFGSSSSSSSSGSGDGGFLDLLRPLTRPAARSRRSPPQHAVVTSEATQLARLLLCSPATAAQVILKCPQVLQQGPAQVASRLTALRQALPRCDLSVLVERLPQRFLTGDSASTCSQVAAAYALLAEGLPGADVAAMVEEDPVLLFLELRSGIAQLHDLWRVDEAALAASDPGELGLAVRALSREGPPRRF